MMQRPPRVIRPIDITYQQELLHQAARNLEVFAGEWVVLRGDLVADHSHTMSALMERNAIQDDDAIIYVPEEPFPQYVI